jgi:hypothetical protein
MINRRTVTVLGTLAVLTSIGAGLAISHELSEARRTVSSELAFPTLDRGVDAVNVIQLMRADGSETGTVTLAKTGDGWIVEERDGYPARAEWVQELLLNLSQLELIEQKTAEPGKFDRLDLVDVAQDQSNSTRLVVSTIEGDSLVDAHFGKTRDSLSGGDPMIYLRRTDEHQTYLAEGELSLRQGPPSWLFRGIMNVPRAPVVSAVVRSRDGDVVRLEKTAGSEDFMIADLPEGQKIKSQYSVNNIGGMLEKLAFEDVRDSEGLVPDPDLGGGVFELDGGARISLRLAQVASAIAGADPKIWLGVDVEIAEDATPETRAIAEQVAAATAGWAYQVSDYTLSRFETTLESLIEPVSGS